MISDEHFKRAFKGFYPYRCAVIDRETLGFVLFKNGKKDTGDRRLIRYSLGPEPSVAGTNYKGFVTPSLAATTECELVMADTDGGIAALGPSSNGMQKKICIRPGGELESRVAGLTVVSGRLYAFGGWRGVCYREGADQWISIRGNLPDPKGVRPSHVGFEGLHGFNREDLYGVGGKGDVWRFDGQNWHQCEVPTDMYLESVCCAGDGYVYVGMQSGNLMRGRENEWEVIHEDAMTLPFKDMVWFDNRLWCTSDYGVWTVENGKLKEPDLPPEVKACSGNLSTADGVLLLAGLHGAALYDGTRWDRLF
jgi:hypothetical protein